MRKHYNITVAGRVQGVFFRASTKTSADHLNIHGFVKNLPDGTVYIEAEGEDENLKLFLEWCSQGPKAARVDSCEVHESEIKNFKHFEISR
ncbi:MAG TPA: acylphosphatase [Chryseosolibacter sp.]